MKAKLNITSVAAIACAVFLMSIGGVDVLAGALSLSPSPLNYPPNYATNGSERAVTIKLKNAGSSVLNISSIAKTESTGPVGWLAFSGAPASIPAHDSAIMTVTLNKLGVVNNPGMITSLQGHLRFTYTAPLDSADLNIDIIVSDQCHANSDADNNGVPLTIPDAVYMTNFIKNCGPFPPVLYSFDLDGNGVTDSMDIKVLQNYFTFGMSAFAPYGGYPVACPCTTVAITEPDTVQAFGMQCVSFGNACLDASSGHLTVSRTGADGSCNGDCPKQGVTIKLPSPNVRNLRASLDSSLTIPTGASLQWEMIASGPGSPAQVSSAGRLTDSAGWYYMRAAFPGVDTVIIDGFRDQVVVFHEKRSTLNSASWQEIGKFSDSIVLNSAMRSEQVPQKIKIRVTPTGSIDPLTVDIKIVITFGRIAMQFAGDSDAIPIDSLRVRSAHDPLGLDTFQAMNILGLGIPSFVIDTFMFTNTCCLGLTGNVDCDPGDGTDISDLSALIDNLYISFTPLCCVEEANVDGQAGVDISDLSALIDYLYITFTPTAACP